MKLLNVPTIEGIKQEKIFEINELSYLGKLLSCKDSKKRGINYLEIPCAFDIETTNVTQSLEEQEEITDTKVYEYLKKIKIRYNENIKLDIADFEKKRKLYFGKLKLSKSTGTPVDILYLDLTYLFPEYFSEEIKNPSDQLLKIMEVFDNNTPSKEDFRPFAFMYHWQFCFEDEVVFGRTWEEFVLLMESLEKNLNLSLKNRLVVWVHSLSFEWQFMRNFLEFEEGFFLEERKPAKILTKSGIEFRCSYALSNMSLSKFCKNEEGVIHYKLDGEEYDYNQFRLPTTPLSEYEQGYCYNDVRGLCECIRSRLKHDTLASIPLTSTGYVRRELRLNVRKNPKNRKNFINAQLDEHLYTLCREAFRGGDTHANAARADEININAWGEDIKSSYPAQMIIQSGYPFSAFAKMSVSYYLNNDMSEYALIMKVAFFNIRYNYKSPYYCGMPYIALAKCNKFSAEKNIDNGRVIFAEALELTITNIDLDIIMKEYIFDDMRIGEIWAATTSHLSKEIRSTVMDYFRAKTLLDGDDSKKYEYAKAKARLNSIYGCMVMKIDQSMIHWDPVKKIYTDDTPDVAEALAKYYKSRNNFLSYQQGLFITAFARKQLREMLWTVGKDAIYCDTDSIKGVGDHIKDFELENIKRKKMAEEAGAYAEDRNGVPFYLGLWENETKPKEEGGKGLYSEFKTLGSKKYVYKQGDKIVSTIAGVSKKAGAEYFTEHGVDGLKKDAVITESGHLTAYYNDDEVYQLTIDHTTFTTSSNVALVNNTYKIGVTEEYLDLLMKGIENIVDIY